MSRDVWALEKLVGKGASAVKKAMKLEGRSARLARQLMLVGALGTALLLLSPRQAPQPSPLESGRPEETVSPAVSVRLSGDGNTSGYEKETENELRALIEDIRGAGKVSVMVTLEGGPERRFALNKTSETRTTRESAQDGVKRETVEERVSSQPVLARDEGTKRESPLVEIEIEPRIAGVAVTAEGAGDARVKLEISRTVQAVLGLPAHRIMVLPRKG